MQPRHKDCLPQARGFRTGQNTIHQIFTLSVKIIFQECTEHGGTECPTTHKRVSEPTGFKIASSGDCRNSQLWCASKFGTQLGGSLAPKRVSKPMVFSMASSGDFQNSQLWCASNFGTYLGVSEVHGTNLD